MKALTNILSHLLMLLMLFIVACTEETAEVDNLMRQEQYVTVRMNIPGMTATATRADDGVIESITALAFDDADKLLEIENITTVTNTNANDGFYGTFNLTVPNGTTTIHFLANLPNDAKSQLPTEMGGSEVDVMTSLTTDDFNNLCYWGMTTTWDGNTNPLNVTLYRNMAKISIKPSVEDVEFNQFTQEKLIIMGLDNPNTSGTLIPYNNGFHNTGVAPTYITLPNGVTTLDKTPEGNDGAGYGYSLYVFEHANSNYMDKGLFVFCKIGDAYYSVALTRDGVNPYEIKRNHEYIIYVSDVDDYQTNDYRAESYDALFDLEGKTVKKPINLEVKEKENASLTLTSATNTLYYGASSEEAVTVTVSGIVEGVESLTLTAPGFTIETDYATLENGKYVLDDEITQIDFTLKLTDPEVARYIGVEGFTSDELVEINGAETEIELIENKETNVWWQGAVKLHTPENGGKHAAKIQMPYSNLFDENGNRIPDLGSVVRIDYTTNDPNWIVAQIPTDGDWINLGSNRDGFILITLDEDAFSQIETYDRNMWDDNMRTAFIIQGNGYTLNKVSLLPTKGAITATPLTKELYYNGEKSFTVTATVPAGVSTLYIAADDFTVTQNGQSLNLNDNVYTYNIGDTSKQNEIQFVFTLKDGVQSAKESTTIKFSADYMNSAKVTVTVAEKQVAENVALTVNPTTATLYYDSDNTKQITVTVPGGKTLSQLTITPSVDCFTITPTTDLSGPVDGVYTYAPEGGVTGSVTFTIAPSDSYNFTSNLTPDVVFGGTGVDMNVSTAQTAVTLTATPAIKANADKNTLYYDTDNQTTTVTVNIPKGVSALSITATDFTVTQYNNSVGNYDNGTYTLNNTNSEQTVQFVFTMNNVSSTSDKTSTTIVFSDNAGVATSSDPITISLTEKPEQGKEIVFDLNKDLSISLTFNKPENVTGLALRYSGNLPLTLNSSSHTPTWGSVEHQAYYYEGSLPVEALVMNFSFVMADNYLKTSGNYTITFTDRSTVTEIYDTKTIQLRAVYSDENIIWEGEKEINNSTKISSSTLSYFELKGKKIGVIVQATDKNPKLQINNSSLGNYNDFNETDEQLFEVSIPENITDDLLFTGTNVILKKVYIIPE